MVFGAHEAVDRCLARTGMNGGVMLADVGGEQGVEFFQGMDGGNIKGCQPAAAQRAEISLYLPLVM